mmetsp:Transcript_94201/g.262174  ORF Transcript_94201/g.262174 Transcript_94201/m.262174 type:complete len:656 (-) Transcript_94201:323-2290(-)
MWSFLRVAAAAAVFAVGAAEEYDFIIVGGGLAGSVLANRLSASGEHSVLLLNVAGAPPKAYSGPVVITDEFIIHHNLTADDGLRARIQQPGYKPVPHFSTSETGSSPARMLGGSSLVAISLYLRDHPEALDSWGEGWSWEELRPYFRRAEGLQGTKTELEESDYGEEGPYTIQGIASYIHPLTNAFVRACWAVGLPWAKDLNTEKGAGVGLTPTTQRADGTKMHAYDAYLHPALGRRNLKVLTGARADRLILKNDTRVEGVAYRNLADETDHVIFARKEVILSSGYIYTPRLLFLSGLGPKRELEKVGLPMVKDMPAVGKHLTSARYTPLAFTTTEPMLSQMVGSPISPAGTRAEPAAYQSAVLEATARVRSSSQKRKGLKRPDIVLSFMPLYYSPSSAPLQYSLQGEPWPLSTNAYSILATLGETRAKGEVTFPSASPDRSPVVTHEALTHEEDVEKAKEAVALAMEVGRQGNLSTGALVENGAGSLDAWTAVYDGRGTCRMGEDLSDAVVDYELKVHGMKGLRIVDGSVIPVASPYLAVPEVLAVAEKGAAMILKEHSRQNDEVEKITPFNGNVVTIADLAKVLGEGFSLIASVEYLASESMAKGFGAATPQGTPLTAVCLLAVAGAAAAVGFQAARRDSARADGAGKYALLG